MAKAGSMVTKKCESVLSSRGTASLKPGMAAPVSKGSLKASQPPV